MTNLQTRYSDFINRWEKLLTALLANIAELPHLEAPRGKLQGLLEQVRLLLTQQDVHTASKQQVSQQLKVALADGKKLATFLRTGIKEHFGNRSEKLVEFSIQPFRRKKPDLAAVKPTTEPPTTGTTPATPKPQA
ncbi:MAG: hypothetical protein WAM82_21815 [Thermoanaerobaculia bacterium]